MLTDASGLAIFGIFLVVVLCIRILRRLRILRPYQPSVYFSLVAALLVVIIQYPQQRLHLFAGLALGTILDWIFITQRVQPASEEKQEIEGVHGWS